MDEPAASTDSPRDRVHRSIASSMPFEEGSTILFQGDSITDCGRDRTNPTDLGNGYVSVIGNWLSASTIKCVNRGVSGDRISDLETRWSDDCIAIQPDIVSILVGINDTWRRYDSGLQSDIAEFEACYRRLLRRIMNETSAWTILVEPFMLPTSPDRAAWREDLDPRIHAVRRVAIDNGAEYVALDGEFASLAAGKGGPRHWADDGVHPTQAGHRAIAMKWWEVAGVAAARRARRIAEPL